MIFVFTHIRAEIYKSIFVYNLEGFQFPHNLVNWLNVKPSSFKGLSTDINSEYLYMVERLEGLYLHVYSEF